jgi:hypothetical protein
MNETNIEKFSFKNIVKFVLILLSFALIGFVLEMFNFAIGRYFLYISVPLGAIVTIFSVLLALMGRLDNDV